MVNEKLIASGIYWRMDDGVLLFVAYQQSVTESKNQRYTGIVKILKENRSSSGVSESDKAKATPVANTNTSSSSAASSTVWTHCLCNPLQCCLVAVTYNCADYGGIT